MCGRYAVYAEPESLRAYLGLGDAPPLPNYPASYNAAPTQSLPVLRFNGETRARSLDLLRWGLVPIWAKDLKIGAQAINARAETVASKPMFRDAFKQRRCIVPADAYYEWVGPEGKKQPHAIAMKSGAPMAFAGLWERWKEPASGELVRTFAIVTTDANETAGRIHDRMPVILARDDWPVWLGERDGDHAALLRPCPNDWLKVWPVGKAVGNVKNQGAALLQPVALERQS